MPTSVLYDETALRANRQGQLTARQRQAFLETSTGSKGAFLGVPVALVIIGLVAVAFGDRVEELQGAAQVLPFAIIVVAIVACVMLGNRLVSIPARRRANRPQVEARTGQIIYDSGRYQAVVGKQTLRPIYAAADLLPGNYRFYTFKGTRWLLSAENLEAAAPAQTQSDPLNSPFVFPDSVAPNFDVNVLRDALAISNGFDGRTLEMNRQGRLTPEQAGVLKQSRGGDFRLAIIITIIGVLVIGANLVFQTGLDTETLIGGSAFFVLFVGYLLYRARSASADVQRGSITQYEGAVTKRSRRFDDDNGGYHYFYVVDKAELEVSQAAYEALIEGVPYRVYYAPSSRTLMSIEPAV